jgi:hypothetical protein
MTRSSIAFLDCTELRARLETVDVQLPWARLEISVRKTFGSEVDGEFRKEKRYIY